MISTDKCDICDQAIGGSSSEDPGASTLACKHRFHQECLNEFRIAMELNPEDECPCPICSLGDGHEAGDMEMARAIATADATEFAEAERAEKIAAKIASDAARSKETATEEDAASTDADAPAAVVAEEPVEAEEIATPTSMPTHEDGTGMAKVADAVADAGPRPKAKSKAKAKGTPKAKGKSKLPANLQAPDEDGDADTLPEESNAAETASCATDADGKTKAAAKANAMVTANAVGTRTEGKNTAKKGKAKSAAKYLDKDAGAAGEPGAATGPEAKFETSVETIKRGDETTHVEAECAEAETRHLPPHADEKAEPEKRESAEAEETSHLFPEADEKAEAEKRESAEADESVAAKRPFNPSKGNLQSPPAKMRKVADASVEAAARGPAVTGKTPQLAIIPFPVELAPTEGKACMSHPTLWAPLNVFCETCGGTYSVQKARLL